MDTAPPLANDAGALLQEISDYCRKVRVSQSTFGRLAVNDGKFVGRLRDGGRITTATLERVRTYISANSKSVSENKGLRPLLVASDLRAQASTATTFTPPI